jgi:hypothetical protein
MVRKAQQSGDVVGVEQVGRVEFHAVNGS